MVRMGKKNYASERYRAKRHSKRRTEGALKNLKGEQKSAMGKTTDEKIDEIHQAVTEMRAQMTADRTICANTHGTLNSRLDGLHKKIAGNGQPGLEQKHEDLARRFDRLEIKIVAWASVAVFVGQLVGPKLLKMAGW